MKIIAALGFTLIELLIAIAIVSILVATAIPSYHKYTKRAHYSEIVQAAGPYKLGIEECYQISGDLGACKPGENGVPDEVVSGQGFGLIDSVSIAKKGKIIIAPKEKYGIKKTDTYELTPIIDKEHLIWKSSGNGVKKGYAR